MQYIFELQVSQVMKILDQLEGRYGDLSMQKYSSNVVEKCLKHSIGEGPRRVIQELIDDPKLDQIMQDAYGNYVIQAALNISEVGYNFQIRVSFFCIFFYMYVFSMKRDLGVAVLLNHIKSDLVCRFTLDNLLKEKNYINCNVSYTEPKLLFDRSMKLWCHMGLTRSIFSLYFDAVSQGFVYLFRCKSIPMS